MMIALASIDTGTDTITTTAAHGLVTGDVVGWIVPGGGALPTATSALSIHGAYFVRNLSATTLQIYANSADAIAGTNVIDLVDGGSGGVGTLSIAQLDRKERIERQIIKALMSGLGLAQKDVQRYDQNGNDPVDDGAGDFPDVWLLVTGGDEDRSDESALGMETMIFPVVIDAHLLEKPDGLNTAQYANMWIAKLKKVMMADAQRSEASGERLAIDTLLLGTFPAQSNNEQRDVLTGIEIEIHYRHPEADPYK